MAYCVVVHDDGLLICSPCGLCRLLNVHMILIHLPFYVSMLQLYVYIAIGHCWRAVDTYWSNKKFLSGNNVTECSILFCFIPLNNDTHLVKFSKGKWLYRANTRVKNFDEEIVDISLKIYHICQYYFPCQNFVPYIMQLYYSTVLFNLRASR